MSIINRKRVRQLALDAGQRLRPLAKFTLVAASFLDDCEVQLRNYVESRVRSLPTLGKTIK